MEQQVFPLEGIRIVEMGTHVAIPSAARIMADFGATVIKVEAPAGDGWRYPGPEFSMPSQEDENPLFTMQNTNKRLVGINIKKPGGLSALKRLISSADVFMTSVRMASLQKSGLDYDTLHQAYPRLIYCHNTGYGTQGSEAGRPGFDQATFWARTGATCDWVEEGAAPIKPSLAFGDLATGAQLLSGVLMALLGRQQTGLGTLVSTSLMGCGIWYNGNGIVSAQDCYGNPYPEDRNDLRNPFTGFYQAEDGEWFTTVIFADGLGMKGLMHKMFSVLGISDWVIELELGLFQRSAREVTARVRAEIGKRPAEEWFRIFEGNDITYERCAHLQEVSKDPQAWANGCFQEVSFQNGHSCVLPTSPVQLSSYAKRPMSAMGAIGTHTQSVLCQAGYSHEEIETLMEEGGVFGVTTPSEDRTAGN